jgi:hypothetical protein
VSPPKTGSTPTLTGESPIITAPEAGAIEPSSTSGGKSRIPASPDGARGSDGRRPDVIGRGEPQVARGVPQPKWTHSSDHGRASS